MTTDMRTAIIPKSDQLNADDLIGSTKTIKITKVSVSAGEQPVSIHYEGDNGKPYKPCKSMCRVMVTAWGPDGNTYAGHSMTLYRDDKVTWGGLAVGGIRISHMSHIDSALTLALTATKSSRKAYTVQPLAVQDDKPATITRNQAEDIVATLKEMGIETDALLTHFCVKRLGALTVEQLPEIGAWIDNYEPPQAQQDGEGDTTSTHEKGDLFA